MHAKLRKILITGGAGFIGSAFVRLAVKNGYNPVVVDKLTYAGDLERLRQVKGKYRFYKADICDKVKIGQIFKNESPEIVIHFAAESHVDRSIQDASPFIETNIKGTQVILDCSRKYELKRFIHLSTDEVYGDIAVGKFNEKSALKPNSPYAASKAAADLLVQSYIRTYNFPAIIVRPSNNYGPWQYPEKFIPRAILTVIKNQKIPVYADGKNVREWLYVEDCAEGIYQVMKKGKIGTAYNLGSNLEKQNIQVAKAILRAMEAGDDRIEFVKDRLGHDIRYSIETKKINSEINWRSKVNFETGLKRTVDWCAEHQSWLLSKWEDIVKLYK